MNVDKNCLKNKIGIKAKKVLLYAPTFRADMSIDSYSIDYERLKETLFEVTKEEWNIGVRLHPSAVGAGVKLPQINGVIDFSLYPDMYELMQVTDLMVTDYSSTMFEAAFSGIPVILFATDIDNYNKDRKFYFNIRDLPFPLAETNDELMSAIRMWDNNDYIERVENFKKQLGVVNGGNAASQVAEVIKEHLQIEKGK